MAINEKIVFFIAFAVLFFSIFVGVKTKFYDQQLDSAVFVNNISITNIFESPKSQINQSAVKYLRFNTTASAEELCSIDDFNSEGEKINMFDRHLYIYLYPLAVINKFFSEYNIAAFFHVLTYIGLLAVVYLFLRSNNIDILSSTLFAALVLSYSGFDEAIYGQYYSAKIFILPATIFCLYLHKSLENKQHYWMLVLMAVLSVSMSERSAIFLGGFTILYLIIKKINFNDVFKFKIYKNDYYLFIISILILLYAFLYIFLFQSNINSGEHAAANSAVMLFISSITQFFYFDGQLFYVFFEKKEFVLKLIKFLLVNMPFIILSMFSWRIGLVAFLTMLPNILGDLEGAEKIGWSSHYHSTYIPFLIAASCIGFINFHKIITLYIDQYRRSLLFAFLILYSSTINAYALDSEQYFEINQIYDNKILKLILIGTNKSEYGKGINFISDFNRNLASHVPKESSVTTIDKLFPSMINEDREVHVYPWNLGVSEFLVLPYQDNTNNSMNNNIYLSGISNYLGLESEENSNNCMQKKIWENYNLKNKFSYNESLNYGIAILEKND